MRTKVALVVGALVLAVAPALALAMPSGQGEAHGKGHGQGPEYEAGEGNPPGPKAGLPEKAKAYGRYCKGASRKHVKGEKGTEFSRCVTAMAKAANHERMTAREACKGLGKKHEKGQKGTEFSRCVTAAAKLRREEHRKEREEEKSEAGAEGGS
jgi:hypothetical protein